MWGKNHWIFIDYYKKRNKEIWQKFSELSYFSSIPSYNLDYLKELKAFTSKRSRCAVVTKVREKSALINSQFKIIGENKPLFENKENK